MRSNVFYYYFSSHKQTVKIQMSLMETTLEERKLQFKKKRFFLRNFIYYGLTQQFTDGRRISWK